MGHYRSEMMNEREQPCWRPGPHSRHITEETPTSIILCPGVLADLVRPSETVETVVDETGTEDRSSELTDALMRTVDIMTPIIETADGLRTDLERRGWSPTAAEQAALAWLLGAINSAWGNA